MVMASPHLFSPPPCGEGLGVGVERQRANVDASPLPPDPHPSLPTRRRENKLKLFLYRTPASARCHNASTRLPRRWHWGAGKSNSAKQSTARKFSIPSSPVRRSADWLPCR